MARLAAVALLALLAVSAHAQAADPAAAGSASSGGAAPVGGAAPAQPVSKLQKKFQKLSTLGAMIGGGAAGVKSSFNAAVQDLVAAVLDNQLPFMQPEGILDLGSSGAAAIEWPAGNGRALTDFAAALKDPSNANIASLAAATGQMLDGLCTPEQFTPSQFVPAGCSSPEVELRLVPAECLLEAASGAATCRPAYLLLETRAAVCTGPYYAAAQWVGRSCAPYALVGPKIDWALGYNEYTFAAPDLSNLTAAIKAPLAAAGDALLAKVGAVEAKKKAVKQALVAPVTPAGGSTATTAAVDGAGGNEGENKKGDKAGKEEGGAGGNGAPAAAGGASSG